MRDGTKIGTLGGREEERERYESKESKQCFAILVCVRSPSCMRVCSLFVSVLSVRDSSQRDKCMKCYCGGAGPAPEEVLGFDNALTRNALQAAAKWACRCSGVGSQVWSVQFWPLRCLGGPFCSAVVQRERERERAKEKEKEKREKEGREGEGLCVLVSSVCIDLNECVCVCVFPLRGGSERNATVPLHMSTPLRQLQGLLKTDTHP